MNFPADLALAWLGQYLWALSRVGAMLMIMTAIGGNAVSMRIRMALTFTITYLIAPVLPEVSGIELFSVQSVLVVFQQVIIGFAMGFMTQLMMQTFVVAGQVIGMQTSLGFASMVDPNNGQSTPVVGQFYMLLATLLFLALDGHLQLITMLAMSFETLPIGLNGLVPSDFELVVRWFGQLFLAALIMALSAIVALLVVNFSFGIMTRAAPQLNIFSIGFAVSMLFGIFILWLSIGGFMAHYQQQWTEAKTVLCTLSRIGC